jgi:hypothetical protein
MFDSKEMSIFSRYTKHPAAAREVDEVAIVHLKHDMLPLQEPDASQPPSNSAGSANKKPAAEAPGRVTFLCVTRCMSTLRRTSTGRSRFFRRYPFLVALRARAKHALLGDHHCTRLWPLNREDPMFRGATIVFLTMAMATPSYAMKLCALYCPNTKPQCILKSDGNNCTCQCHLSNIPDWEKFPAGTKLSVRIDNQIYNLPEKTLKDQMNSVLSDKEKPKAGVGEIIKDVLEPKEANPKGEPGLVVLKDDGTIGGYYRKDGEFEPGKPKNMK